MQRGKRWLALLLALVLAAGLLPTAALANGGEPEATDGETDSSETSGDVETNGGEADNSGTNSGETGSGEAEEETLSDGTAVDSPADITRAQMAEMVYEHKSLKTDIDSLADGGTDPEFTDIEVGEGGVTQDQRDAIIALYKANIINGTTATTFGPTETVTRGEFAVVLWRATGCRSNKTAMTGQFTDTLEPWYAPAVNCFYGAGLVQGTASGAFSGGTPIPVEGVNSFLTAYAENKQTFIEKTESGATTRAEMTVEFYNRFYPELSKLEATRSWTDANGPFTDLFGCTDEQIKAIRFFYERGIINGTTGTTFHPHTPVSNLQVAALLQECVTTSIPAETQEAISLFSAAPLAEEELETPFDFLVDQGLDVSAAENNPNAPALTTTLTTWRDALAPEAPTFSPESGTIFTDSQTVTIAAASGDEGAAIYYTIDNSDPTTSSTLYREAITITEDTTVKAIAVKNNLVSSVATADYTVAEFTITPSHDSLTGGGTVTFTIDNPPEDEVIVTCDNTRYNPSQNSSGVWSVTLPNTDETYVFTAAAGDEEATCTVEVTYKSSGSRPSSGSGTSSSTTTETVTNPDGSKTTTVTNNRTDTVTETTEYPDGTTVIVITNGRTDTVTQTTEYADGSSEMVETASDGTVTTTSTDADGGQTRAVENPDGSAETTVESADGSRSVTAVSEDGQAAVEVSLSADVLDNAGDEAVPLPMPAVASSGDWDEAPMVTVELTRGFSARVEIPVERAATSTVAVLVHDDGTEEIIRASLTTENGVVVTLSNGDTVKIVDNGKYFDDVPDSHWGADAIDFVSSRELFSGTGEAVFSPDTAMSRAMLVTVLARFEGVDTTGGDTWYGAGRQWAMENGISDGANMDQVLTREQLATMLYRYAGSPAADGTITHFSDGDKVSSYAADAMQWAVSHGLIGGMGDNTLNPQGNATRAQVAAILMRFIENFTI